MSVVVVLLLLHSAVLGFEGAFPAPTVSDPGNSEDCEEDALEDSLLRWQGSAFAGANIEDVIQGLASSCDQGQLLRWHGGRKQLQQRRQRHNNPVLSYISARLLSVLLPSTGLLCVELPKCTEPE